MKDENPIAPSDKPGTPVMASKASCLAKASLILGIFGLLGILGLAAPIFVLGAFIGLILGIVSVARIIRSRGTLGGLGLAWVGTVVSAAALVIPPYLILSAQSTLNEKAQAVQCFNHMKQLAAWTRQYAEENHGRLPTAGNWCDALQKYGAKDVFLCPSGDATKPCHYAFNAKLSGAELGGVRFPAETVLFFETDGGWNVNGGPELLVKHRRHRKAFGLVFVSGECALKLDESFLQNTRWEP